METRVATALTAGSATQAAEVLGRAVSDQLGSAQPVFAMVFASTAQPLRELLPALRRHLGQATLLGASTAGEFTERGGAKGAAAVFAVAGDFELEAMAAQPGLVGVVARFAKARVIFALK